MTHKPEILAPAGDKNAAMAALAAGADAIYLGLKHFSARMQADNFSVSDLSKLVELAHNEDRKVYVALNSLLKPGDPASAGRLISRLDRDVHPDALIVQDLGSVEMARQAGFSGEVHLSTLANVTHPSAFISAQELGVSRVILPRELNVDEVRQCSEACPEGMSLELFVHGALCWCVSGRCWWSSYMGGKSGLRGRCVQPCRRVYQQKNRKGRFFSCMDLSLDVLTKALLSMSNLTSWKIEGRKKGPHYVYYTTTAYKLLLDNPDDPQAKKQAEEILEHALGRPRTHATFLPQRPYTPTQPGEQTSSGLLAGVVKLEQQEAAKGKAPKGKGKDAKPKSRPRSMVKTRFPLLAGDFLRVGYEDEPWHFTTRITKPVPKGGAYHLFAPPKKYPKTGTPVFLIDRREKELTSLLKKWNGKLARCKGSEGTAVEFEPQLPGKAKRPRLMHIILRPGLPQGKQGKVGKFTGNVNGLWLSPKPLRTISKTLFERISWWLPPVIWPNEEHKWKSMIREAVRKGARHFVLGAPLQVSLFENVRADLMAGPFCNVSNPAEVAVLKQLGFRGAIVSPELSGEEILQLPSMCSLPLGIVMNGYWPMGISRWPVEGVKPNEPFSSPKGESFWMRRYGQNNWVYPGWPLDLTKHRERLLDAGYSCLISLTEEPPASMPKATRTTQFNWDVGLL